MDPTEREERDLLIEELSWLLRDDPAPFVSGPIIEPNDTFFPEAFTRDADGMTMMADCVLVYAGLPDHSAVVAFTEDAFEPQMHAATRVELAGSEGRFVHLSCTQIGRADTALHALVQRISQAAWLLRQQPGDDP